MKILGMTIWTKLQRETFNQMARMTDRELRDIGISRYDIRRIVDEMDTK